MTSETREQLMEILAADAVPVTEDDRKRYREACFNVGNSVGLGHSVSTAELFTVMVIEKYEARLKKLESQIQDAVA